jgi:hypothetical protein
LKAQVQDRADERQHEANNTKYYLGFAVLIIIGLFAFFGIAIVKGKDQIVMEIIKAIMYVGAGGISGYSYSNTKRKKTDNQED